MIILVLRDLLYSKTQIPQIEINVYSPPLLTHTGRTSVSAVAFLKSCHSSTFRFSLYVKCVHWVSCQSNLQNALQNANYYNFTFLFIAC